MTIQEIKKQICIIDFAREIGLHPLPVGHYYTLKEHDSVRIDPIKNIFIRNSTGECGSVIDFAMTFTGCSLPEAIKTLSDRSGSEAQVAAIHVPSRASESKLLELPERDTSYRNVFAYLIKSRGIDPAVVNRMVKDHHLYQDTKKNCVFVSYENDQPVFACKRGTNTYKRFVADVAGSDYKHGCFFPGEGNATGTLLICESVIDLMSYWTLKVESRNHDALVLAGVTKLEALYRRLVAGRYTRLIIALDNDSAGLQASETIRREVVEKGLLKEGDVAVDLPERKDWNEELKGACNDG